MGPQEIGSRPVHQLHHPVGHPSDQADQKINGFMMGDPHTYHISIHIMQIAHALHLCV